MTEDKGDSNADEIAVYGELTERGLKAGAKARILASIQRFLGSYLIPGTAEREAKAARTILLSDVETKLIAASAEAKIEMVRANPLLADAILERALSGRRSQKQENLEAVLERALEDLSNDDLDVDVAEAETLIDTGATDRIGHYAECASTEELRERWGKVLAQEIRKPGTFNRKVLRVIDELDHETALLFERLCKQAYIGRGNFPLVLASNLTFDERTALVEAGLFYDLGPDAGIGFTFGEGIIMPGQRQVWVTAYGDEAVLAEVPKGTRFTSEQSKFLTFLEDQLSVVVGQATEAGACIATLVDVDFAANYGKFAAALSAVAPEFSFKHSRSDQWRQID